MRGDAGCGCERPNTRAFPCNASFSVLFSWRKAGGREECRMPQSLQSAARTRDLLGYAGSPPDARWPGGARVAVSIVVNFEEGAEFSVTDGDPENEAVYEIEQRLAGRPDPAIDSHSNTVRVPGGGGSGRCWGSMARGRQCATSAIRRRGRRRRLSKALLPHVRAVHANYFNPEQHVPFYRQSSRQ